MLTKILFTLVVIVGVAIFYRQKAEKENASRRVEAEVAAELEQSVSPRTLAYILIGVLVAISIAVFAYSWQQDNQVIDIRVTAESGEIVTYQAYQKDIKGRSFISLSGSRITLGESDRVEMIGR